MQYDVQWVFVKTCRENYIIYFRPLRKVVRVRGMMFFLRTATVPSASRAERRQREGLCPSIRYCVMQ